MKLKKRKIKFSAIFFLFWLALLVFLVDGVLKFQTLVNYFGSYALVEIMLLLLVILPTWAVYRFTKEKAYEHGFQKKVAVVTGGAQGIGRCITEEFHKAGAIVCIIDKQQGNHFVGDLADKLINNALPLMKGISECSYEEFQYALSVGVTAPFYLAKLFAPHFAEGAAIVNISSSRDRMSQPQTESYTAAKGGIAALTHTLAVSLAGKVRVNSISPGWIDTALTRPSVCPPVSPPGSSPSPDALQQPVGRVGNPMDIANMVLYLCSNKAGFITGENICIDGGITRLMIYHGDNGWTLKTE